MAKRAEIRAALDIWANSHLSTLTNESREDQHPELWSEVEAAAEINSNGVLGNYYAHNITANSFTEKGSIWENMGAGNKYDDGNLILHDGYVEMIVGGLVAYGTELDVPSEVTNTHDAVKVYIDLYLRDRVLHPGSSAGPISEEAVDAWVVCEEMAGIGEPGVEDIIRAFEVIEHVLIIHRNQINNDSIGRMAEELEDYASDTDGDDE